MEFWLEEKRQRGLRPHGFLANHMDVHSFVFGFWIFGCEKQRWLFQTNHHSWKHLGFLQLLILRGLSLWLFFCLDSANCKMVPPLVLPPKSCCSMKLGTKKCEKHTVNNIKKRSLPKQIIWNRRSTSKSTSSPFFRPQSSFSSSLLLFFHPWKTLNSKKNTTDQVFLTWASPKQLPEHFWELRTKALEWINRSTLRSTQDAGRITQGRIDASIWEVDWCLLTYLHLP